MADASSFTITELTGEKRTLELKGRALPYQPFEMGAKMRAEFTWYPGNPSATIQVLGNQEKPSVVRGLWKDRFIKQSDSAGNTVQSTGIALLNNQPLADAKAVKDTVESIRIAAQEVEVKWDDEVRRGLITDFTWKYLRREDIEWECEFSWGNRGTPQVPVSMQTAPDTGDFFSQLSTKLDELKTAIDKKLQVVENFTTQVEVFVSQMDDAVLEIENAAKGVADSVLSPFEAAERTLAAAETVKNAASGVITVVESFPAQFIQKVVDVTQVSLSTALESADYTRDIKDRATELKTLSAEQSDVLKRQIRSEELLASFSARGPMDLRDVSQQYYNTPDEWRRLMLFNDLSSSRINAGTIILVPKLTVSERGV